MESKENISDSTYTGGCLCGKIQYQITGPIGSIMHCHCSKCRKWRDYEH